MLNLLQHERGGGSANALKERVGRGRSALDLPAEGKQQPEPSEVDSDDDDHGKGVECVVGTNEAGRIHKTSVRGTRKEPREHAHSRKKPSFWLNGSRIGETASAACCAVSVGFDAMSLSRSSRKLRPKFHARYQAEPE